VVTVLGPRQCGKTTFIRRALPDWTYLDLERPSDVAPLAADPEARLAQITGPLILDEAQRLPELFPVLRGMVDRRGARRGRYVVLGSASPSLVRHISESLAGRTAFLDLPPFRWDEVAAERVAPDLTGLWFRGGFPVAFLEKNDRARHDWLEGYTRTFIERDLAALGIDVSASQMRRLWTMLAHANGGIWNASQLAASRAGHRDVEFGDRHLELERLVVLNGLFDLFKSLCVKVCHAPVALDADSRDWSAIGNQALERRYWTIFSKDAFQNMPLMLANMPQRARAPFLKQALRYARRKFMGG
jgi:hypothetical protein